MSNLNTQQASDDEKIARELQQAELGQAGMPQPIRYGYTRPPVVQGTPVPAAGGQGQPAACGVPAQGLRAGQYAGYPVTAAVVVNERELTELTVLRYRYSVMCFAFIDMFFTSFRIAQVITDSAIREDSNPAGKTYIRPENLWWFGIFGLIFLIGPLCGYIGAKGLRRNLVTVYVAFCTCNLCYEISLAVLTAHLWLLFTAIIQLWITKIVCNFWSALGHISIDRCAEILKPDYTPNEPIRVVYW
jgi:hypothetical protein